MMLQERKRVDSTFAENDTDALITDSIFTIVCRSEYPEHQSELVALPTELIINIASHLPTTDQVNCMITCRELHQIILTLVWRSPIITLPIEWPTSDRGPAFVKRLNLSQQRQVDDDGMNEILTKAVGIQQLNLAGCGILTLVTAVALSFATKLTCLNLYGCQNMNDDCMTHIATISSLTSLSVSGCRQITDLGIARLTNKHLKKLRVADLTRVTWRGLVDMLKVPRRMTKLDLARVGVLNDDVLYTIADSATKDGSLEWLSLARDWKNVAPASPPLNDWQDRVISASFITDYGLKHLVKRCPRLVLLDVCYNTMITDDSFQFIAKYLWHLVSINFTGTKVGIQGLRQLGHLRATKRNLSIITLGASAEMSDELLQQMMNGSLAGWRKSSGEEGALKATNTWWSSDE
jgi:hypothetical protein